MRFPRLLPIAGLFVALGGAWAFQRPFREYPGQEYTGFEIPPGANEHTEFVMGRLMFPASPYGMFGMLDRYYDWREGRTGWTNDYPRADRHFAQVRPSGDDDVARDVDASQVVVVGVCAGGNVPPAC